MSYLRPAPRGVNGLASAQRGHVFRVVAGVCLAVFCVLAATSATAQATLEGVVNLKSVKPGAAPNARYQLNSAEAAKPEPPAAVVYLEGNFPANTSTNAPVLQMGQRNFQFTTSVLPVQKGTRVEFPNFDDDYHNVFSYSKSKRFDLGRYRKDDQPPTIVFDQAGEVKLYCEIHEHMRAVILVLDTPYFVKTDGEGKYRLNNLPEGNFTLKVWRNSMVTEKAVQLKPGETLKVDFPDP